MMEKQHDRTKIIFISVLAFGSFILLLMGGVTLVQVFQRQNANNVSLSNPTSVPTLEATPSQSAVNDDELVNFAPEIAEAVALAKQNLALLQSQEVPENNPVELAARFFGIESPRVHLSEMPAIRNNGEREKFWILDVDHNTYRQVTAELVYQTPHLYFWVEKDVSYNYEHITRLATTFEKQIYPTNRDLFGYEWSPGVDNAPQLAIIYARQLGGAAGYFSGTDSLLPEVKPFSNAAEMFYLSADHTQLDGLFTYGVLAHEFQHMIHWHQDRNETSWLNEGMSELAVEINGLNIGGFDDVFAFDPDLSLTFWPGNDQGDPTPHYGASYLFMKYILSQYGRQAIQDITQNPKNGMGSIDEVMRAYLPGSAQKSDLAGDQLFQNWVITNFLQNKTFESGLYSYGESGHVPTFSAGEELTCGGDWHERSVHQYGTDYIDLTCDGDFTLEIEADPLVDLLSEQPRSGKYHFWSNRGDESHMTLSREFDLTYVSAPVEMNYWTWFDIERDYDYLYLSAFSQDGGWELLQTQGCTIENPTGANYGCGYNGQSSGWVLESVDLSSYAGKKVKLQFEYITDAAVNGDGFLLDDVALKAAEYFTDFENDDGGWQAEGFVRVSHQLPQTFSAALISQGLAIDVEKWMTSAGIQESRVITVNDPQGKITLAISGLTRYSHIPAAYRIKVSKLE